MSAIDFADLETITFLTDALTVAGVDGLEISSASGQLHITVSSGRRALPQVDKPPSKALIVRAPMAGVFCLKSGVTADVPHPVAKSEMLGFLRIGPVLVPLIAGRPGLLTRRSVEPGALVGFGDALFEIEPQL